MRPDPKETLLLQRLVQKLASIGQHVYSRAELEYLFDELRSEWTLPKGLTRDKFRDLVVESGTLKEIRLTATYPFKSKRYGWGRFSDYELALSLRPDSYLSHGTAAYLHGLADRRPNAIYVNKEQSPKRQDGLLDQAGLNRAFSSRQRLSNYIVTHGHTKIVLLCGKDSGRLGVKKKTTGSRNEPLEFTDLERTLIDITVRPAYAGGIDAVLRSYIRARRKVDIERLAETLADLEYLYPYHQAVGFLLQRAGCTPEELTVLREAGLEFDFFLAHGMKKTVYDPQWQIHYPMDFTSS
jgi:hypothetical protein